MKLSPKNMHRWDQVDRIVTFTQSDIIRDIRLTGTCKFNVAAVGPSATTESDSGSEVGGDVSECAMTSAVLNQGEVSDWPDNEHHQRRTVPTPDAMGPVLKQGGASEPSGIGQFTVEDTEKSDDGRSLLALDEHLVDQEHADGQQDTFHDVEDGQEDVNVGVSDTTGNGCHFDTL